MVWNNNVYFVVWNNFHDSKSKKMIAKIFSLFCRLFYNKFNPKGYSKKAILQYIFMQKIIGINRSIKWPVHWSSQVIGHENIETTDLAIGYMPSCYIDGRNGIKIGKNVILASNVSVISQNHDSNNYEKYIFEKPIWIADNCWIGTQVVILPGIELGQHTIVAAGAVVTKSFPEGNQIIGGNPAVVIKKIDDYIEKL